MALLSRPHSSRVLVAWALAMLLALGSVSVLRAQERAPTESEVQAAFLLNFASFVEWPAGSLAADTFVIGVLGRDPFGPVLDAIVLGEKKGNRKIVVRRFASIEAAGDSNVLFVSGSDNRRVDEVIASLSTQPILTVSDARTFAAEGGMIQFRTVDNRVRFEVNVAAARKAGLEVSSHLLKLALRVHGAHPANPEE